MVFSREAKGTIITCYRNKGWTGQRICDELPLKKWTRQSVNRIIKNYKETGSIERKPGSGDQKRAHKWQSICV